MKMKNIVISVMHIISIVAMDKAPDTARLLLREPQCSPRSHLTFDDLIKDKARLLRGLVALELNGTFSSQLKEAEKILNAGLSSVDAVRKVAELDDNTKEYIHVINGKHTQCQGLKQLIDKSHKKTRHIDLFQASVMPHENLRYVVNHYFFDDMADCHVTLLHYLLIRAKKFMPYAPFALGHLETLLRVGAHPNACTESDGTTPLHHARVPAQIDSLCNFGALCSKPDKFKRTPLMAYAIDKNIDGIQCLLNYNIDLNVQDSSGWTALHHAARMGHKRIVRVLLEAGADYELRNNNDKRPFDGVCLSIKQIFEKHLQYCLCRALEKNDSKTVLHVMDMYPWIHYVIDCVLGKRNKTETYRIVNWIEEIGISSLYSVQIFKQQLSDLLCYAEDMQECTRLIEEGADVNIRGSKKTHLPLFWALKNDQDDDKIKLLLKKGAIVTTEMVQLKALENKTEDIQKMIRRAYLKQNK